jgi:hypothetical protein
MSMAICLSYLLLEVVMLIRITILNRLKFSITLEDSKFVLKTGKLDWTGLESDEERWGGVQARVLVQQRDLEQREDDQDEDEVNLQVRISN